MRFTRFGVWIAASILATTSIVAQDRKPIPRAEMDKYVVSAKAGVVSLVEGDARVLRSEPLATPEKLLSGDELQSGDTVSTATKARAEILLNPGCYLRLGEQSEFVFLFNNLTGDRLKVARGSAVLEVSALEASIIIETPKSRLEIARDGLYRFNVDSDGTAEVAVHKGRALVGGITIKQGKRAAVEGSTAAIAKLNKQDKDILDNWSRDRSKALIAANSRLANVSISRTLGLSFMRNAWIFDPFCSCYTFLPFSGGFTSPYGWDYLVSNPYGYYYSRPRYNNGSLNGGGNNSGGGSYSGGGSGGGSGSGSGSGSGGGSIGGGRGGGGGTGNPTPPSQRPDPSRGTSSEQRGGPPPLRRP